MFSIGERVPQAEMKCREITFTHRWVIDNFTRLYNANAMKTLCSAKFSPPQNEQFQFNLQLTPRNRKHPNYMSIGLVNMTNLAAELKGHILGRCKTVIVDDAGKMVYYKG